MKTNAWLAGMVVAIVIMAAGVTTGSEALTLTRDGKPAAVELTLSKPMPYQVVQRDARNQGQIPIQGSCSGRVTRVDARYELMKNTGAVPSAWARVCDGPTKGAITGSLTVPAGGWYRITVRALDGDKEIARQVVEKVGVGEVFIVTGQSNSGNFGWPRQMPMEDRVAAHCPRCKKWRHGHDPQPWAWGGYGGSPWPTMADALVRALDVPVTVFSVGAGGTSVEQWLLSSKRCYPRLKRALDFLGPHGARAILWHQGESDAHLGTSAEEYVKRLGEVINQSRKDAGWEIPWGVAIASYLPKSVKFKKGESWAVNGAAVRQGQKQACLDRAVFEGPFTDDMTGREWRHDTVHFSGKGLREHGKRWAKLVLKNLFPNVSAVAAQPIGHRMSFSSPMPGFVAQRDAKNQGVVPIIGAFEGSLSKVEARRFPMKGGEPSAWMPVACDAKNGIIDGKIVIPAGWYRLEVRGLWEEREVVRQTINRVGIGEVFLVVGGESVANLGHSPQVAKDTRASGYCLMCLWRPLRDPLRGAVGNRGSSWPAMGDALVSALDLPVMILVSGYTGPINKWKPGTSYFSGGLKGTFYHGCRFRRGGFRAILWEVGEMDAALGTSADDYAVVLGDIITQLRKDFRWDMPWVIGGVAYHPEASEANRNAVREGQRKACDGKTILEGPTSDDLTGPDWRYDGIHFTEAGLQKHGKRWALAVQKLFPVEK